MDDEYIAQTSKSIYSTLPKAVNLFAHNQWNKDINKR